MQRRAVAALPFATQSQPACPFLRATQYFYRSAKPCVHYIPFWERGEKDVYGVLDALSHQDELAQRIGGLPAAEVWLRLVNCVPWADSPSAPWQAA